jgi:small conductance mechanosensitive channel
VVDIGVAYDADVDAVLAILRDEAKQFGEADAWVPKLDGMPEVVGVQSLGDNAVTIRVLLRTQPGNQWEAGREFRRLAKIRLDREGVEIPFPQRTVHVRHHGAAPDDPATRAAITDAAAGGA